MINKYFTVDVAPTIAASLQNTAFAPGDVLFDWTPFQVPKGSSALHSAVALVRPKGDAAATINNFGFNLVFSKTNTQSLGTPNSVPVQRPSNDILGVVEFEDVNYGHSNMSSTAVATMGKASNTGKDNPVLVLTGDPDSGDNIGYDTLYVAAIATGAFDFTSINVIDDTDINTTTPTAIVMAGASMDVREHFIAGDILHSENDILLGTVDTIDATATGPINLTVATSGAGDSTTVADGDTIYSLSPVRLKLSFEK